MSEEQKKRKFLKKYKLTIAEYDEMIIKQQGKCTICGEQPDKICIDHDHKTGKVRGILCSNCNSGLGFFKDNTYKLLAAIDYLKVHSIS